MNAYCGTHKLKDEYAQEPEISGSFPQIQLPWRISAQEG